MLFLIRVITKGSLGKLKKAERTGEVGQSER
jgi:hypothetical protein